MFGLLLWFLFYFTAALGLVLAVFLLPGWVWAMLAAAFMLVLALAVADGLGCARARRTLGWLFWTQDRFIR